MNLKRLTALLALVYGLAAMSTALVAWYQEFSLLRHGEEVAAAKLAATLREYGTDGADMPLNELARILNWSGAYITEVNGTPEAEQKIVAGSLTALRDMTWSELDRLYPAGRRFWHGSLRQTYIAPNGRRYAVWALMDQRNVAWPLLHQIALVAAVAAWLAITTWVSYDVTAPSRTGWTVLTLFTGPLGLAIWLTRRPPLPGYWRLICPGCGRDVPAEAGFCPACGFAVQPVCQKCGHPISYDAVCCKFCGAAVEEASPEEGSMPE